VSRQEGIRRFCTEALPGDWLGSRPSAVSGFYRRSWIG